MRIALAQIDTTVGDVAGNTELVLAAARDAHERGADLVVFPEGTLTGYPAKDLLEFRGFRQEGVEALDRLHAELPVPCLVGYAEEVEGEAFPRAHNSAALVGPRVDRRSFRKTLLPTYDVFDEARHFLPAAEHERHVFELGGVKVGVTICEDMWNDRAIWPESRYVEDPVAEVVASGAQVIVNLSASPFAVGRVGTRHQLARGHAKRHGVPLLFCNLVGGNDDLVFDGASFAIDARGELAAQSPMHAEDLAVIDVDISTGSVTGERCELPSRDVEAIRGALTLGVRDYVHKCGFKDVVLGLSGGIDSAVVAWIACEALGPEHVTGLTMPSRYSSDGSVNDSVELARNLGMTIHEVPIEGVFGAYLSTLEPLFAGREPDVTEENLQARIRGALLMAHSNKFGSLLLTTGNKSEVSVGYCTLYGDMCGGLAVISDVFKGMVYELARHSNDTRPTVPEAIITKPPSAELRPDQVDQDSLPPYDVLDQILELYIEDGEDYRTIVDTTSHDPELVRRILRLVDLNEYKRRQMPPGLRISEKAFGAGRRFPIAMRRRHT